MNNSTAEFNAWHSRAAFHGVALLAIILLISGALQSAGAQPATEEYKVKAAFLFHFAQLVEWPAGSFGPTDQSITLCLFDDEPHLLELQTTIEGKAVGARILHVRPISQSQGVQGCNILFLSHNESHRQAAVLRSLHGQPVLTVGETDNFLSDGGMIRLRLDEDKVRFDINAGSAGGSRLKISSRLLVLATSVTLGSGTDRGR